MKSKFKNGITFAETIDVETAVHTLLRIQEFTITLYEEEGFDVTEAHREAKKLIFAKPFYSLSGNTMAQWVASGGSEKKGLEVVKDLIVEAVKESTKQEEQKVIMAKVFSNKK